MGKITHIAKYYQVADDCDKLHDKEDIEDKADTDCDDKLEENVKFTICE